MLPWALAYMLSATQSAKLVERFGQRRGGELGPGHRRCRARASWRRRAALTSSYWLFALGLVVQALGMGITTAPSTGAIMRSLPLHKAGVGSAVNDTTRELGGALGVAVLGSLVASHFRVVDPATRSADCPAKATHSLAEALQHAARSRRCARRCRSRTAARDSFVDAFSSTLWVAMARRRRGVGSGGVAAAPDGDGSDAEARTTAVELEAA